MTKEQIILEIAKKEFNIETLETRGSDDLDFFETSVWSAKDALSEAYEAGKKAEKKTGSKSPSKD